MSRVGSWQGQNWSGFWLISAWNTKLHMICINQPQHQKKIQTKELDSINYTKEQENTLLCTIIWWSVQLNFISKVGKIDLCISPWKCTLTLKIVKHMKNKAPIRNNQIESLCRLIQPNLLALRATRIGTPSPLSINLEPTLAITSLWYLLAIIY